MSAVDKLLFKNRACDSEVVRAWRELVKIRDHLSALVLAASSDIADGGEEDAVWQKVYDEVFSEHISKRVETLESAIGSPLEYYDPDTTYREDALAFIDAVLFYVRDRDPNR